MRRRQNIWHSFDIWGRGRGRVAGCVRGQDRAEVQDCRCGGQGPGRRRAQIAISAIMYSSYVNSGQRTTEILRSSYFAVINLFGKLHFALCATARLFIWYHELLEMVCLWLIIFLAALALSFFSQSRVPTPPSRRSTVRSLKRPPRPSHPRSEVATTELATGALCLVSKSPRDLREWRTFLVQGF